MSTRRTPFIPGEYYHLSNCGNSKQVIFRDKLDYCQFIKLLYIANTNKNIITRDLTNEFNITRLGRKIIYIGAYSLTPNQFHLIVSLPKNGNISKFMQKLQTAYSMYFNVRYSHTGSLFEGKFKSKYIYNNRYLRYLFSYVLLKPIRLIKPDWHKNGIEDKEEAISFLSKYEYSCLTDFIGPERVESKIIDRGRFPGYFYNPKTIKNDIFEWINNDVNIENSPNKKVVKTTIIKKKTRKPKIKYQTIRQLSTI